MNVPGQPLPWHQLSAQAQLALKDELDRLLAQAPNQPVVGMIWEQAMRRPETIPYALDSLRKHLAEQPQRGPGIR